MKIDIKVPYTTRPQMKKNLGEVYNKNPNPLYIEQKKIELERYGDQLYGETHESKVNRLIEKSCRVLGLVEKHNILDFGLQFEEDVAIMHQGKLAAILFCFPSSWIPAERLGMSLSDIHRPVAESDHLVAFSDKLAQTMSDPVLGSFRRQVWTITSTASLSNHPSSKSKSIPKTIDDLYFRLETQTTLPLGDCVTSLFFVKVEVVPLNTIWQEYNGIIKDSINSMSNAILDYKGLGTIKSLLV